MRTRLVQVSHTDPTFIPQVFKGWGWKGIRRITNRKFQLVSSPEEQLLWCELSEEAGKEVLEEYKEYTSIISRLVAMP